MPVTINANSFERLLNEFAQRLQRSFASTMRAQPEDQLKSPLQVFMEASSEGVQLRTEVQVAGLGGRPDIGVAVDGLLCGYIELKAPGKGAKSTRFRADDKKQFDKFKALPNLIYTDSHEWALYRFGELASPIVRFDDLTTVGSASITQTASLQLYRMLTSFLQWNPVAPASPQALAAVLAPLCRLLRTDVLEAVKRSASALSVLAREWRSYLFPDADDDQFADAYAQTLTYALLLARINGAENLTTASAADALQSGHGLLAQALRILTQPEARQEISLAVDVLERVIRAVDPELLKQRGDPWLYFYEDFLSKYDPKLRASYGVYYTPPAVIKAQVQLVSELLRTRFNKPLGYADDDVVFLDPAAGTSAYPLAAIEHGLNLVEATYGPGMVASRATECARNFHAFEILVGPYAVGHLRLTKLLMEKGATLPTDGIRVLLTDTLESPYSTPSQPPLFARQLTEEHRRAQALKNYEQVLICMGNPPYDRQAADERNPAEDRRKGGWVRFGDRNHPDEEPIFRDFTQTSRPSDAVHTKNLYNDYVYFWRWALWKLYENPNVNGPGIISFITASSYLRGPGFASMRRKLRESFDEIWIIDLEGDQNGPRRTDNVFAIMIPVAILIGVRSGQSTSDVAATTHYTKIVGSRNEKLATLEGINSFADLPWQDVSPDWGQPLIPRGEGDFFAWPLLTDLMPWQHSGVQYKRTWPISPTSELCRRRWETLLAASDEEQSSLLVETDRTQMSRRHKSFLPAGGTLPPLDTLAADSPCLGPVRYGFRSFDRWWALPDARLCDRARPPLWAVASEQQVYMSSLLTNSLGSGPAATVSAYVPDLHSFRGSFGGKDVIPLWRDSEATTPNVNAGLLAVVSESFATTVTAEMLFAYTYAVLANPGYTSRFSEELGLSSPRVPITKDANLFSRMAEVGAELIRLHTFGERFNPTQMTMQSGTARSIRAISSDSARYPEAFSYDAENRSLTVGDGVIRPVEADIWSFQVSGLPVVESWLRYRMKGGFGRSSSALDELRPQVWTAAMTQDLLHLLWLLEHSFRVFADTETLLQQALAGELFTNSEVPTPSYCEREEPNIESPNIQLTL